METDHHLPTTLPDIIICQSVRVSPTPDQTVPPPFLEVEQTSPVSQLGLILVVRSQFSPIKGVRSDSRGISWIPQIRAESSQHEVLCKKLPTRFSLQTIYLFLSRLFPPWSPLSQPRPSTLELPTHTPGWLEPSLTPDMLVLLEVTLVLLEVTPTPLD